MKKVVAFAILALTATSAFAADYKFTCTMSETDLKTSPYTKASVELVYKSNKSTGIYDAQDARLNPSRENAITALSVKYATKKDKKDLEHKISELYIPAMRDRPEDKTGVVEVERWSSSLPSFTLKQKLTNGVVVSSLDLTINDYGVKFSFNNCTDTGLKTIPDSIKKAFGSHWDGQGPGGGYDGPL